MNKLGVVVLATPGSGGTYQYSLSLLEALRYAQGYEITVYSDPLNPDIVRLGFPIRKFSEPRSKQSSLLAADALGLKLEDVFSNEDVLLAPIYSLALLHTAKPFAYTLHDLQEFQYPKNFSRATRFWRRNVHGRVSRKAARVICESQYVRSDIVRIFGVANEKVAVIAAPPLRQAFGEFSPEKLSEIRDRLGLPESFVFYPAQFWPHKNHLRLVAAFKQVVAVKPDLKLVLTGKERDQYQAVMAAIEQAGLQGHVQHLGYIEQADLQGIYHLAAGLVMPSLYESISIPIYEAFQAGTPVAASGILAIPEQAGEAALLFDPLSTASIAESILNLVNDKEYARRLGGLGRQKLATMTPKHHCAQLEHLLGAMGSPPTTKRPQTP